MSLTTRSEFFLQKLRPKRAPKERKKGRKDFTGPVSFPLQCPPPKMERLLIPAAIVTLLLCVISDSHCANASKTPSALKGLSQRDAVLMLSEVRRELGSGEVRNAARMEQLLELKAHLRGVLGKTFRCPDLLHCPTIRQKKTSLNATLII